MRDAVDGFLAKRFEHRTEDSSILLDPLAARRLLVSIFVALSGERWTLLNVAVERASAGEPGFVEIISSLRDVLAADEFAAQLEPAVAKAYTDAVKLIGEMAPAPSPPPTPPPPGFW